MATEKEELRARLRYFMEEDYLPAADTMGNYPGPEHRVANALEYIAYQLGQIRKDVARIADKLDDTD